MLLRVLKVRPWVFGTVSHIYTTLHIKLYIIILDTYKNGMKLFYPERVKNVCQHPRPDTKDS